MFALVSCQPHSRLHMFTGYGTIVSQVGPPAQVRAVASKNVSVSEAHKNWRCKYFNKAEKQKQNIEIKIISFAHRFFICTRAQSSSHFFRFFIFSAPLIQQAGKNYIICQLLFGPCSAEKVPHSPNHPKPLRKFFYIFNRWGIKINANYELVCRQWHVLEFLFNCCTCYEKNQLKSMRRTRVKNN